MADTEEDQRAADRIMRVLRTHVRNEFPYMKSHAMDALLKKCDNELKKGIVEQQPQMAATKARIGFLSLSAALRNTIYWLVMEPDPDIKEEEEMYSWEDNGPVLVIQSPYIDRYGYDPDCYTKWWFQPNITKVSRQLRKEALAMFYGNIEFRAYGSNCEEMLVAAQERLRHIGKDAKLIKHFHVLYETTRHHEDRDLKSDVIADLYPIPPSSIKVMVEAEHGAIRGAGVVETVRGYIDL